MQIQFLLLLLVIIASVSSEYHNYLGQGPSTGTPSRLSKLLIGDDDRIYTCSERNLFAFESNGSIVWTLRLAYTCNDDTAPVHGGKGKIYLIAENRILQINFLNVGTSPPTAEVFFGPEEGQQGAGQIIGLAVSTLSSYVFINIKNRGLFAYTMGKQLAWSAGPVLYQFGYRLGCLKGITDCYFTSVPVIDRCEASIYIPNTAGELYSLSLRSPRFNWVQDLSSFHKDFTVTAGNNGRVYVTIPVRSMVLALDVSMGNILWQQSIGPVSTEECAPIVDSNGWISINSLDGFLYSISPTGILKKLTKASVLDSVGQVGPFLDCSGYAVYISQTEMEGKTSNLIGEYTYVTAMRPKGVVFTLLIPATGTIHWSEKYPGQYSSSLSQSDLRHFVLDEGILLAFIAASNAGNPILCRSKYEKLVSTCSQTSPKPLSSSYTGNDRKILLFLLFESIVLIAMVGLVRFCCIFWRKKKLRGQNLGNFLEKRRSLQLKKKQFNRTITELQQKAAEETVASEVIEKLRDLVRKREGVERKLSTTYSLGRDRTGMESKSLLPVFNGKTRSYSFQSGRKESVNIFHTLSDTSSRASSSSSSSSRGSGWNFQEGNSSAAKNKAKAKAPAEAESSLDDGIFRKYYKRSPSEPASSSKGYISPMFEEKASAEEEQNNEGEEVESTRSIGKSLWLKRRRNLSSTNEGTHRKSIAALDSASGVRSVGDKNERKKKRNADRTERELLRLDSSIWVHLLCAKARFDLEMGTEDMISLFVSSDFEDRNENGEGCKSDSEPIEANSQPRNSGSEEGALNLVNVGLNEGDTGVMRCTTDEQNFGLSKGGMETEEGTTEQEGLGCHVGETVTERGTTAANNVRSNAGDSGREEGEIDQNNFVFWESDIGTEACPSEVDMDLVDSPAMQVNIEVASMFTVAENPNNFSARASAESHPEFQNQSLINNLSMDGSRVSGFKRARMTYDEDQPSVHVTYNSLTRASKQKLEELLQQWSAWQAQNGSLHDGNEVLQSGEETYFPALRVGVKNTSAVSFWIENQTRKQEGDDFIPLDSTSVPLYDRGYALGLTSADGPANGDGGLIVDDAARCFNCGSYNHSLKECRKPRDHIAVNHARKQHKSRRNQSASSRNQVRYYQSSSGGKYDGLKPGALDAETRQLLHLGELDPPPWLNRMQELGYPPGYLDPDDDDQPSGITIFGDGDAKEEHEEGEIAETRIPEPRKKKSVEFPGINAPIPEKADERLWSPRPSSFDRLVNQSHHRYSYSSEPMSRWHHHEQRWSRDLIDDGPPGVESVLSPSMSSYPPRGRRSSFSYDDSTSPSWHESPPYLYSNKRSSPYNSSSGRSEDEDYRRDNDSIDYSARRSYEYDRYRHRSRR